MAPDLNSKNSSAARTTRDAQAARSDQSLVVVGARPKDAARKKPAMAMIATASTIFHVASLTSETTALKAATPPAAIAPATPWPISRRSRVCLPCVMGA